MSTYKPPNSTIFLYDFQCGGVRFHGSTGCKTKRDADRVEAKKRAEIALDDGRRKKPQITLDDAAGLYEIDLRARGKWSATTDYIIVSLIDGLGGERFLSEIVQDDLSRHFATRAGHVSGASVNREIEVARPIWRRLRKTHDVGEMPDWGRLRYAVPDKDPRELYHDEEDRLFPAVRDDHHDFHLFALKSGWRLAEITGLLRSKVNLGQAIAETRIKGGDWVKRPLTPEMVAIIANQPKAGAHVFTYVCQKSRKAFTDCKGRKHPARLKGERYPFSASGWRRPWKRSLEAAEVGDFRFHDLRHTRGTRIVRTTNNLAYAKEALKHRSIKTTLRYVHAADDDVRRALEASDSRTIPEDRSAAFQKPHKTGKN